MDHNSIKFNKNWNHKLDCNSFSTIRLSDPNKFKIAEIFMILEVNQKGETIKNHGFAKIVSIHNFFIEQLTDAMSYIDCNIAKNPCIDMIKTMYKNKNIDFTQRKLSFIILQFTNQK